MGKFSRVMASAAVLALATAATATAANIIRYKDDICMIAHRGYSDKHPDNTEASFLAAVTNGSGGIETDVRITADGVLVVSHNDDVKLIDGEELPVATSTYEQLTSKPILNNTSDEECYLCTFRRYLEICRDNNMICFIELKGEFPDEKINEVFTMAGEVYDLSRCELQSFVFENLIKAHETFPELKIMLTYGSNSSNYERCFEYGFDIDADYRVVTPKMVKDFHSRGLKVGLWTANNIFTLNYCRLYKVDFIESDVFGGKRK